MRIGQNAALKFRVAGVAAVMLGAAAACSSPPYQPPRVPQVGAQVPPEVDYWKGSFDGADGVKLFEQGWRPSGKARAAIVFVHDLKDHSSRYRDLGIQLAHRGVAFYGFDQRGHGYSEGVRDHIDSLDDAVADVSTHVTRVRERQPGVPLFIVGQGLGASLAALYAERSKPDVMGLVLVAPLLRAEVKRSERFGMRMAAIFTSKSHSQAINLEDYSSDPKVVAALKADPLIYDGELTAATVRELVRASDEVQKGAAALSVPVLFLHGEKDRLTSVEMGRALESAIGSKDKKLTVYEGLAHGVFHEPARDQVIGDVLGWMTNHAAATQLAAAEAEAEAARTAKYEAEVAAAKAKVVAKKSEGKRSKLMKASQKTETRGLKKARKTSSR